ncbi:hypothetical protein ES708_25976 [subsurface metagenome]
MICIQSIALRKRSGMLFLIILGWIGAKLAKMTSIMRSGHML